MKTIEVVKDFVLTLEDHTKREFKKGVHEVEDFIADHWYTKGHAHVIEPEPTTVNAETTNKPQSLPVVPPLAPAPDATPPPERTDVTNSDETTGNGEPGATETAAADKPPPTKPITKKK